MRLEDKTALITGGAGDLGRSIARAFLASGASAVLFDSDEVLLSGASQELSKFGERVCTMVGDVRSLENLEEGVRLCESRFGTLDILVTCAGVVKHMPIDEMPLESWQRVLDINLTGTFLAAKAVVPPMKKRKSGRIITISSLGGRTGRPYVGVDYASSKAGVVGLTMCLARELGPFGITVNAIAPGIIEGRFTKGFPPEKVALLTQGICINRLGRPDDVAYAALYLASDESGWITGEVLDINGGLYI
ncbi:MAG: SDR family NAD(P)-dependent oxidoreductase [Bacillota bacterium]